MPEETTCPPRFAGLYEAIRAEIRAVYEKVLFRAPTPRDLRKHFECYLQRCETLPRAAEVARDQALLRTYLGIRPLFVEMDVINKCNIQCVMCHFSNDALFRAKREEISVEDFARFAEQVLPFCYYFSLSCSAEPLLHGRMDELLEITGQYEVPYSMMYTNGLLLKERIIASLIHSKLSRLDISIDGATKDTYERIRVGGNYDKLIANIRAFNRAKQRAGSETPHLHVNVVLMRSNIRELPALIRLAVNLGAEGLGACHMFDRSWVSAGHETLDHDKELCNRMLDEAHKEAEALGLPVVLPSKFAAPTEGPSLALDLVSERERIRRTNATAFWYLREVFAENTFRSCCQYPWHFLAILWSGDVFPCGSWANEEGPLGNIRTSTFEEMWNNDKFRALRAEHLSGALRPTCRDCPAFGMGSVDSPTAFSNR